MSKKIFASLVLLVFVSSNFIQAFEPFSRKGNPAGFEPFSRKPVDMTKEFSPLDGDIQIQYQDITAQNAGRVVNRWTGKENINKRFIMTGGVYLELNKDKYDKLLNKVDTIQSKLNNLKSKKLSAGKIELKPIELIQYPDRLTIKQDYDMVFENKKEYDNFKKYVGTGDSGKAIISDSLVQKQREGIEKLIKECKADGYCKDKKSEDETRKKIAQNLIDGKKIISVSEQVSYNLIPMDISNLKEIDSPSFNLKLDPSQVRISLNTIKSRFEKITIFNKSRVNITEVELDENGIDLDKIQVKQASAGSSSSSANPNMSPQEYCSYFFLPEEDLYGQCMAQKRLMDRPRSVDLEQLMLNGFTIGNSRSDDFNKVVSVPKVRKPWENTVIFRARANRSFSYGVGLRIPFITHMEIEDKWVPLQNRITLKTKINMQDLNANQYRTLGLPERHIFGGKEFVLEVKASIFAKVVLFGEDLVNNTWGLGSLLPNGTPGKVADGIDLGNNFSPPLGNNGRRNLVDVEIPIPVVDIEVASAKINLIIESYIDGIMKARLNKTNFQGDDLNITYDSVAWRQNILTPVYSNNPEPIENVLGDIGRGGIVLNRFDYRPRLTFALSAEPELEVWIPGRGNESWSFGSYELFSFQVDPGVGLTRHAGTDGDINVNTFRFYKLNTQISAAKQADNERRARMERNAEIAQQSGQGQGIDMDELRDVNLNPYGQSGSSSSNSSRSTRQDGGTGRIQDQEGMENLGVIQDARDQARSGGSSSSSSSFRSYSPKFGETSLISGDSLTYTPMSLSGLNLKLKSQDNYVEDKLKEANEGFVELYDDYMNTIDETIKTFTESMESSTDKNEKNKYKRAIDKVNEVKEIFLNRYKFIINYSRGIFSLEN